MESEHARARASSRREVFADTSENLFSRVIELRRESLGIHLDEYFLYLSDVCARIMAVSSLRGNTETVKLGYPAISRRLPANTKVD